jgi:hypothetical protein
MEWVHTSQQLNNSTTTASAIIFGINFSPIILPLDLTAVLSELLRESVNKRLWYSRLHKNGNDDTKRIQKAHLYICVLL